MTMPALVLTNPQQIAFGVPAGLRVALARPLVAGPLVALGVITALLSWLRGYWSAGSGLRYLLVVLAFVAAFWWLRTWNLLGCHSDRTARTGAQQSPGRPGTQA